MDHTEVIKALRINLWNARNELCYRCGDYEDAEENCQMCKYRAENKNRLLMVERRRKGE